MNRALIAFEGIDGSGKSTQIRRLNEYLCAKGYRTCLTAEPTNGVYGREIRNANPRLDPITERKLFLQDRKEHLSTLILPALAQQKIVLTDRYFYSSIAYQGTRRDAFAEALTADELERERRRLQEEIERENRAVAPDADLWVFMRISPKLALERIDAGRETRDPFEALQNLIDVADAFERMAAKHSNVLILDAAQSPEAIFEQLRARIEVFLAAFRIS